MSRITYNTVVLKASDLNELDKWNSANATERHSALKVTDFSEYNAIMSKLSAEQQKTLANPKFRRLHLAFTMYRRLGTHEWRQALTHELTEAIRWL